MDTPVTHVQKIRRAFGIDLAIVVFAAMMIWPFPMARQMLSPLMHVVGVFLTIGVVAILYPAIAIFIKGKTVGQYFQDMYVGKLKLGASLRWGAAWAVLVAPVLVAPNLADGDDSLFQHFCGSLLYKNSSIKHENSLETNIKK